jgi:predicted O-methyltransferase YrrM
MGERLLRKIRYLRHPYLIARAINLIFATRHSQKHCLRLDEYKRYSVSLEKTVEVLTGAEKPKVTIAIEELKASRFLRHVKSCEKQIGSIGGPISTDLRLLLYLLVRFLRPEVVVETGVANGFSSSFILKALDQNAEGILHSIDLHYREGLMVPLGKELGWVIPNEIRYRWSLHLGESTKVLPKLLSELGSIDIFFHDSRHTYKTMMSEYEIAWPYLKNGGLLVSDDATSNDAFLDFADLHGQTPLVFNRMGLIRKKS